MFWFELFLEVSYPSLCPFDDMGNRHFGFVKIKNNLSTLISICSFS